MRAANASAAFDLMRRSQPNPSACTQHLDHVGQVCISFIFGREMNLVDFGLSLYISYMSYFLQKQ